MPNGNNAFVLELVLARLARNTRYSNFELIVDDRSTDGNLEILGRWSDSRELPELRLVEHQHTDGGVMDALNQKPPPENRWCSSMPMRRLRPRDGSR
jgi:hypothetical protein